MSAGPASLSSAHFTVSAGCLRAEFAPGAMADTEKLFRALAAACVREQYRRVLIVAGEHDRAGEHALRDALTVMVLAGLPAGFRLALVASSERGQFAYCNALQDLCAAGIAVRVLRGEEEARGWLDGLTR